MKKKTSMGFMLRRNKKVGDFVCRRQYLDDGTWRRKGDDCLVNSPLMHGVVVKVYKRTGRICDGPVVTDILIDVLWDDGKTGTYFPYGVNKDWKRMSWRR